MSKRLEQLSEIAAHLNWSEDKVLNVQREDSTFPVKKMWGRWTSHTELLDNWFQEKIVSTRKTT